MGRRRANRWVNLKNEFSPKHTKLRKKNGQKITMVNISINIPIDYENQIQELILDKKYPSRSEAIRIALHDFLHKETKFLRRLRNR